jgi:hypothetical protein
MRKVYTILFLILAVLVNCKKEEHVQDIPTSFDSIVKMPYDEVDAILGKPIGNKTSFLM